jgi:hypothetical protein
LAKRGDGRSGLRRRTFAGVRLDAAQERDLRRASEVLGYPIEWQTVGADLVVTRPEFAGEDYRQLFEPATPRERKEFSQQLFARITERLQVLRHGAIHPQNVLNISGKTVFVDAVANAACLGGEASEIYHTWLWAPRLPPGWDVGDWDRINLLRMMTLLARGSWDPAPAFGEALEQCGRWAEELRSGVVANAGVLTNLVRATDLLDRLRREGAAPPPAPIAAAPPEAGDPARKPTSSETGEARGPGPPKFSITAFVQAKLGERLVLKRAEESSLRGQIAARGEDPTGELFEAVLLRLGVKRPAEITSLAKEILGAGKYEGSKYVRRSACRSVERLWRRYGLTEAEAAAELGSVLAELGLHDELSVQPTWALHIDRYVAARCPHEYSRRQFRHMLAWVSIYDLPPSVAIDQLRHYLETVKELRPKRGLL